MSSIAYYAIRGAGLAVPAPIDTAFFGQSQPVGVPDTLIIGGGIAVPATQRTQIIDAICQHLLRVVAPARHINAIREAMLTLDHAVFPDTTALNAALTQAGQWLLAQRAEVQA